VRTFPTDQIRNVAVVGHQGAGKTTLAEALLFATGTTNRMGRVEDGNTVSDFDAEEHKRGLSVGLSLVPFEHDEHKVNLIDSPGYADFVGDVAAALAAADLALFVISAVEGVEVQTEVAWRLAEARGIPRAFFVNKLDRERANFSRTLDQLKAKFGAGVAPLQLPIGEEAALSGIVELLDDHAVSYADGSPIGTDGPIPDSMEAEEHAVHDALVEGIVVADDALMERYLMEETLALAELEKALAKGVDEGTVFPVLCGSATRLIGIDRLAHFLVEEAPAPHVGEGPTAVHVFKTIVDQYVGHVNLFKVAQGTLRPDDHLANLRNKKDERFHQLFVMRGKEQESVSELAAGDIGAVAKLADVRTGDVLSSGASAVEVSGAEAPVPLLATAIRAKNKNDEDKLANALHRLEDEDPVIRIERNPETHQTLLWGTGETHLSIALSKLSSKFGVEVDTDDVRVPYRETITGTAEAEGKVKKQTGGHGQFAIAWLRVEPNERGGGVQFTEQIVGGVIPRNFIPAVEKGVTETVAQGGAFGFPVVDVKVTVFDGKHHPVDSSEMAFKTAAATGLREALAKGGAIVLEPISELVITVPEAYQGDVMGDLNSKRGRIQGSASIGGGEVEISAFAPTSEVMRYSIDLRSMTGGRGRYVATHSHYDPLPAHLMEKITAAPREAVRH
jgi:elongation factor G